MANVFDRAGMSTATVGTGTLTLGSALGAVAPNACTFQSFSAAGVQDKNVVSYLILDSNTGWETGWGVYTASGTTLTRNVTKSSNANAAINLSGSAQVFITMRAEDVATIAAMRSVNLAINGGMEVSQENTNNAVTITPADTFKYVVDMFCASFHGTNVYTGQQIGASGMPVGGQFRNALEIKATTGGAVAATDYMAVTHRIEGQVFRRAGWGASNAQPITIGFWMAATINGTVSVAVRNGGATRSYVAALSYASATGWQWMTVTIPADTTGTWAVDNSVGADVLIWLAAGSSKTGTANAWTASDALAATGQTNFFATTNNVVDLTGFVALPGAHQLSYEHSALLQRSFPEEADLCTRYYEKTYNMAALPGTVQPGDAIYHETIMTAATIATQRIAWHFKKRKRAPATVTWYSPSTGASGKVRDFVNNADVTATNILSSEVTAIVEASLSAANVSSSMAAHGVADARM
jgi:hypothetical protein